MSRIVSATLCLALATFVSPAYAKKVHAPLPAKILIAKTVYIDNQSGFAAMGDRAYDELRKWGKYELVDSPTKADLVLLLSAHSYDGGYVSSGNHNTYGTVDDSGNVNLYGNSSGSTRHVTVNYTHITLVDPQTGAALWSDQKRWGWHSATRGLIKELRDRVQEQENSAK